VTERREEWKGRDIGSGVASMEQMELLLPRERQEPFTQFAQIREDLQGKRVEY